MISNENITLEQEILGGLINDNSLIDICRDNIKVGMFQFVDHKEIYKTINKMISEKIEVDTLNLIKYSNLNISKLGGVSYITEISRCITSNANYESKIRFFVDEFRKRELMKMVKEVPTGNNVEEMLEIVEKHLEVVHTSNIVKEVDLITQYEEYLENVFSDKKEVGFKSGLEDLDNNIGNLQRGRLITVFARSGIGKSTFAIQIALNLVLQRIKVVYGSGEMSYKEIFDKMMASKLGINYQDLNKGNLSGENKERIAEFIPKLLNSKLYVTNETDINKFISEIKLYKLKHGLDVVFVDYINKYISATRSGNLTEKIGEVTSRLKELALKEDICVVMLAQANRKVDSNNMNLVSDKLSSSDIQDSARIEQDSDQIIALYRNLKLDNKAVKDKAFKDKLINMNTKNAEKNPYCINATITKNRHGEKNTIAFKWDGERSKITDWN